MNPPAGIDMSLIREAMARRSAGGGMPAAQQVSMPQGGSPLQTPPQTAPTGPLAAGQPQGQPAPQNPATGPQNQSGGQPAGKQPSNFDDGTRATAKALIARLMQVL